MQNAKCKMKNGAVHYWLLGCLIALLLVGIVNMYSAVHLWNGGVHAHIFIMHLVWIFFGALIAWRLSSANYRQLETHAVRWHVVACVLLLAVCLFGRAIGGNRSWLGVGGFGMQPSELAKLTSVFVLARFFSARVSSEGFGLTELGPAFLVVAAPALLILWQGDMGNCLFLGLLFGSLLLFAKMRRRTLLVLILLGVLGATSAYHLLLGPAQQSRITMFLHPESDARGRGYHVLQARIAVGSGGWFGQGYLRGQMNQLRYLPEKHTDFVFPVLAEEWGFAGASFTLLCLFGLLMSALEIVSEARDRFGTLLGVGIVFWFFWQIAVNLGGVLGLLPLTGVTLPFLSYGGSSMLVSFAAIGLLLSVHRRKFLF